MIDQNNFALLMQTAIPAGAGTAYLLARRTVPGKNRLLAPLFFIGQAALLYYSGYTSLTVLATFGVLLFAIAWLLKLQENGTQNPARDVSFARLFFGLFLAAWFYLKYLSVFAPGPEWRDHHHRLSELRDFLASFALIGISYIGFKLIHFYIDYRNKAIKEFQTVEFLSWLFFFPSIVAGPMQRFQDWQEQRTASRLSLENISEGVRRIVIGLVMKTVIADSLHQSTLATMSSGALATDRYSDIFLAAMAYTVYLYFDFSGYSSIAIGLGHFWGMRLPENFNAPYRARNLAEFWNRWHISLSELLRDYLYYPISLALKRREFFKLRPRLGAVIPPIATFLLAGIWHGATFGFVIFGFLHGIGLAAVTLLGRKKKNAGRFTVWWRTSRIGYLLAVAITFFYVSFTFIFFCLSNEKLSILLGRMTGGLN